MHLFPSQGWPRGPNQGLEESGITGASLQMRLGCSLETQCIVGKPLKESHHSASGPFPMVAAGAGSRGSCCLGPCGGLSVGLGGSRDLRCTS